MTKENLEREIVGAFSGNAYPGDAQLITHPCAECDRAANAFRGLKWSDFPKNAKRIIAENSIGFISFLSPRAFQFFLPGFMLAVINDYKTAGVATDSIINVFEKPSKSDWLGTIDKITGKRADELKEALKSAPYDEMEAQSDYLALMKLFSAAQLKAIVSFLVFLKQTHPDDEPVEKIDRAVSSINAWISGSSDIR